MSTPFLLTRAPVMLSAPQVQPLYLALDVSAVDHLAILVGVPALSGSSPSATVQIITGMQNQTEDGWVSLGDALTFTTPDTWKLVNLLNESPLRFIRWKLTALSGTSPVATLHVSGEGTTWGNRLAATYPTQQRR